MKDPTPQDFDSIFARLAKMGWIYEAGVIDDPARGNPLAMAPTPLGEIRLLELYRLLLGLGKPPPSEGEWVALFGLILRYGQKRNTPERPESDPRGKS